MGIYFQTARLHADNPEDKAVLEKEPVQFANRGWTEFAADLQNRQPEIADLLTRFKGPIDGYPRHPTYLSNGEPMRLAWTADECRRLFLALAAASKGATETAYDFWEFTALVCCGINEEGISSF